VANRKAILMTIRNLPSAFQPRSVAVIGASVRPESVGHVVLANLVDTGFEGPVWPVNPKYSEIDGRRCFASVAELPQAPDLAVIVTPPASVPGLIGELGARGTRAAVVITAGLNNGNGLRQAMLDAARPHLLRIIGPNTLGIMVPRSALNASFAHIAPAPGGLALLSQSGAIATSLIDWAAARGIGFSHVLSLGDMADVDVGDCLDQVSTDRQAQAVLMYLETIVNPRKFLSAARAAARLKPVVAVKAGRSAAAAKAAATHTGALAGGDKVTAAAFRRAGILRVDDLAELFSAAETLAHSKPLERARVGIVTNGGGAGVLAIDRLVELGGELAELAPETIAALDQAMPATWSRANPVDIIGDAPPERYRAAVAAVAADAGVDVLLVMNCPTALGSSEDAAAALAAMATGGRVAGKPVVTAWLGEATAELARVRLEEAGIACHATPEEAARAVAWLDDWSRAQRALMRVPGHASSDVAGRREEVQAIFARVAAEGRTMLSEPEAKAALAAYGIAVPDTRVAATPAAVAVAAQALLDAGHARIVVKLLSRTITHKSDVGGVVLGIDNAAAAAAAAEAIIGRLAAMRPGVAPDGFAVQPMVVRKAGLEFIIGVSRDPLFGPAILFGAGGTAVEVLDDAAVALPPLDDVLGGDLIDSTRIGRLARGWRDTAPVDRTALLGALNAVSAMVVDFPCLTAMDINPLVGDAGGVVALDARIEIDPQRIGETGPNPDLAIRPWPADWQRDFVAESGERYLMRAIKPADIALYDAFFAAVTTEDMRLRFLSPRRHFTEADLVRLTQLDYDRDMAFVAIGEDGAMAGVGRISADPDRETGEYGLLVRSDLQGRGIGRALLRMVVEFAQAEGIGRIEGFVLAENDRMLEMCRAFGFTTSSLGEEPGLVRVTLDLRR